MMYCRWENLHTQRYYKVALTQDLFQDWIIIKAWGSLNNASGRVVQLHSPSYEEAVAIIEKISKTRMQRGYQLRESTLPASQDRSTLTAQQTALI